MIISLFPTVFFALLENFSPYLSNSEMSSANFQFEESKICYLGKV